MSALVLTDDSSMPYGKYEGKAMHSIPADYLLYIWEDNLWDGEMLRIYSERTTLTIGQQRHAMNRLAVHRYIKDNFALLEKENKDIIIKHRPQ